MIDRESQRAADQGDADAQYRLGEMYYEWSAFASMYRNGEGLPKDNAEALKWFSKAAEQGHKHAQYQLGDMYYFGQAVTKDYKEAMHWYHKAAEQGHAYAQCRLGEMYRDGQGVPKDCKEAAKWFQKSSDQGMLLASDYLEHVQTAMEREKNARNEAAEDEGEEEIQRYRTKL